MLRTSTRGTSTWYTSTTIRSIIPSTCVRCHQRYYYNTIRCFILAGSAFASTGRYRSVGTLLAVPPHALRAREVIVYSHCGARDGERGGATILVYAWWYCKEARGPLYAVHHAAYTSSLPSKIIGVYTMEGTTKYQNVGLLMFRFVLASSCRTKGPFFIYF